MKEHQAGWLFVAPALLLVGLFFVLPVVVGLALSLTDFDIYGIGDLTTVRFVGFANYSQLADNPLFWQALKNTAVFVLLGGNEKLLNLKGKPKGCCNHQHPGNNQKDTDSSTGADQLIQRFDQTGGIPN